MNLKEKTNFLAYINVQKAIIYIFTVITNLANVAFCSVVFWGRLFFSIARTL